MNNKQNLRNNSNFGVLKLIILSILEINLNIKLTMMITYNI